MPKRLDRTLRKLDRVPAPDLWSRVGSQPQQLPPVDVSPARRIAVAVSALALAGVAVFFLISVFPRDAGRVVPGGASPTTTTSGRLALYVPLIRSLVGEEGDFDGPIFIRRLICSGAEDPVATNDACHDAFTEAEQTVILDQLHRPPGDVRFFDEWTEHLEGVTVWVGSLAPRGDGYIVGGGLVCGGRCGSGGTFRLSPDPDGGWNVTPTDMRWIA